ncbi:MAG: hypothetical protein GY696_15700 [Gammaproteobacteria bacterium]|nr:hypothetical protein [Gammaproteobacteria bacterium]
MKIFKTLIVVTGLLYSAQVMACTVAVQVKNTAGSTAQMVSVSGPWGRGSKNHDLKDNTSFTYNATGSMFSCHGKYYVDSLAFQDHCNYNTTYADMEKDGTAYFHITSVTDGKSACNVTVTKKYK